MWALGRQCLDPCQRNCYFQQRRSISWYKKGHPISRKCCGTSRGGFSPIDNLEEDLSFNSQAKSLEDFEIAARHANRTSSTGQTFEKHSRYEFELLLRCLPASKRFRKHPQIFRSPLNRQHPRTSLFTVVMTSNKWERTACNWMGRLGW